MRELWELAGAAWVYSRWGVVILQGQYASDVNLQPKQCQIRKTDQGTKKTKKKTTTKAFNS